MNQDRISAIINEEIDKVITEDFMGEGHKNDVAHLIKHYLNKHKKHNDEPKETLHDKKKKKKLRKRRGGGGDYYDYDEYERSNGKVSGGDASSIRTTVDTEKTNIAAVARELFPDHTEEGAQSQLRKVLNGERPMTKKIAAKIEKMISAGQIAVK